MQSARRIQPGLSWHGSPLFLFLEEAIPQYVQIVKGVPHNKNLLTGIATLSKTCRYDPLRNKRPYFYWEK
jgi:hypothetical protein